MGTFKSYTTFPVQLCQFEDVLPIWCDELWPNRTSPIEPTSAMNWLGGFSLKPEPASYWRITSDGKHSENPLARWKTIAVASGHFAGVIDGRVIGLSSEIRSYRVRGIWVHRDFRRQGMAHALMQKALAQAAEEKCEAVWIYPRKSSLSLYESMGFIKVGDWITNEDARTTDIGANCYAIIESSRKRGR